MNKKVYIITLVTVLFLAFGGVLLHSISTPQSNKITPEEAENLCYSVMGEKDEETGFLFSFSVTGTYEKDGKQYYVIRASWLVNNSHLSYIGDFFVSDDGKEIYNGFAQPDEYIMEDLIWSE